MTTHSLDLGALGRRAGYTLFTDGPEQPAATARETCILLDMLADAEYRAGKAEERAASLEDTARILAREAIAAEDARDEHRRGKAAAEAQTSEEKRLRMEAVAAVTEAEARVEAAQEKAWEECAAMAAHHGAFDGSRARWLSSINPYTTTEKEKEA